MMALGKATEMRKRSKPTRYPGVHNNGDGTYRLRGRTRHTKTGEQIDLDEIVPAKSPLEASQTRARRLAELASAGAPQLPQGRLRLRTYATSWLASKLPKLKRSTRALYAGLLEQYILTGAVEPGGALLGDFFVDAIELTDLVGWRDVQMATPTKYNRPPSPASVNGRIRLLKELVRDAVLDLKLERDPTLRLETLREGRKRRNSLTSDELRRFLEAARELTPQWYAFFYALAFTGLRFGELTYLRWRDIDEARLCARVDGGQWKGHEDTTKTDDVRVVPLFPEFLGVLREHRQRQLEALQKRAKRQRVTNIDACTIGPDDLVFRAPRSRKHMHNTAPRKALAKCLAKAGIDRRFTVHGHRHTANNLLRLSTKDLVLVRSMMGHAEGDGSISDRYSHVDLDEQRAAVVGLTLIVGGKANLVGNQIGNSAPDQHTEASKT
jgi:integrase